MESTISQDTIGCGQAELKRLCLQYADALPGCSAVGPKGNLLPQREKLLWGQADLVDLFAAKEELLKAGSFNFRTASWCMYPALQKDDILQVEPAGFKDLQVGDIPVYRADNILRAHRIVGKRIISGRECLLTRADTSAAHQEEELISAKDIVGKVVQVQRGRRKLAPEKQKVKSWRKFTLKKALFTSKARAMLVKTAEVILQAVQRIPFYQMAGKKAMQSLKLFLNFELAIACSNRRLNHLYSHFSLEQGKNDLLNLKEGRALHLVMKLKGLPLGCASILNRPAACPYQGLWIGDIYVRLRYRGLGLEMFLQEKLKALFEHREFNNNSAFLEKRQAQKNSEQLLLACARGNFAEDSRQKAQELITEGVDWQCFVQSALRGGVTIPVYNALMEISPSVYIPQYILEKLKSVYLYIISQTLRQHSQALELLQLFTQRNIFVVPLKGTFLAQQLYGDIAARGPAVDFDLLVKEEQKELARSLLEESGYSFQPNGEIEKWRWQYDFAKPKHLVIDLQWDIPMFGQDKQLVNALWQGSRLKQEAGISFYEFKEEELLLYLAVHLANGAFVKQLKYAGDIQRLLQQYRAMLDWQRISELARRYKLTNVCYAALSLAQELFTSFVPASALSQLKPNCFKRILIKLFINKKVILHNGLRRRFFDKFLRYIFFALLEAATLKEYGAIFRLVFFPPKEVLAGRSYGLRILQGPVKTLKRIFKK